jgi:hypothetical protein
MAVLSSLRARSRARARAFGAALWSRDDDLGGFAGVDPPAEDGDAFRGPRSVAWHRARLEPLEDGVGVRRDVVEGPQVEGETHRVAVALAKQWLYVPFEVQRLVRDRRLT